MDPKLLAELKKGLQDTGVQDLIASITKATDNSTGFSTRQSLSDIVEDLTRRNTPLFDTLAREDVINSIHEWDSITSLATGQSSYAGAIDSVGSDSDAIITRLNEGVKYYRTTTTVGQFTDAISRPQLKAQTTIDEKAIEVVRQDLEFDIINGAAAGDNIRGINDVIGTFADANKSISNGSAALTSTANLDILQKNIVESGGLATNFLFNADDRIAFKNLFDNIVRYNEPQTTNEFGYEVQQYMSSFGKVDVMYDQFVAAKNGGNSTAFVLDMRSWALGEPTVNGASGLAVQDLAKTGPANTKLINYYGLLVYRAADWNGRLTEIA